ncbi:hypothetical protein GZL_07651 [Streptomyces sp. 769]|nr:hypothetical protein GZL_07651 [Streptomyces sp. 769]
MEVHVMPAIPLQMRAASGAFPYETGLGGHSTGGFVGD